VSDLVDALERAGYVTREPHPIDRRATVATFTERGRAAATQMVAVYRRTAKDLFAGLNPAEVATFVSTLETLLARLRTNVSG
jgi:DNA-binding MarR family transcriptional regulator